jgi:hypothetical protein
VTAALKMHDTKIDGRNIRVFKCSDQPDKQQAIKEKSKNAADRGKRGAAHPPKGPKEEAGMTNDKKDRVKVSNPLSEMPKKKRHGATLVNGKENRAAKRAKLYADK